VARRPRNLDAPTLSAFVEHARRFGVEGVYETAEHYLEPSERSSLAQHLRRFEPKWKPETEARRRLIADLAVMGTTDAKLGEALGISRQAANAAKAELANSPPVNDLFKPEKCQVFAGCGHLPVLRENTTAHASDGWQSWVYGAARIRHAGTRRSRR
jgi:hypothetical protein